MAGETGHVDYDVVRGVWFYRCDDCGHTETGHLSSEGAQVAYETHIADYHGDDNENADIAKTVAETRTRVMLEVTVPGGDIWDTRLSGVPRAGDDVACPDGTERTVVSVIWVADEDPPYAVVRLRPAPGESG